MNANESFEEAAECFYKATGMLMPGKDIAAASGWTEEREEERQKMFKVWCAAISYMQKSNRKCAAEARAEAFKEVYEKECETCREAPYVFSSWLEEKAREAAEARVEELDFMLFRKKVCGGQGGFL